MATNIGPRQPPPAVGDKLYDFRGRLHHVRAVLDVEEGTDGSYWYFVVLRTWTIKRGWTYKVENAYYFAPIRDGQRATYDKAKP